MNSRNRGKLVLLDKYICTEAEISHTFTKTLKIKDYSAIKIYLQGELTASAFLRLKFNGATSYYVNGTITTSAVAVIDDNTTAFIDLIDNTYLAANESFAGEITLIPSASGFSAEKIQGHAELYAEGTASIQMGFMGTVSASDITSINIYLNTSTWKVGTTISIYGILQ